MSLKNEVILNGKYVAIKDKTSNGNFIVCTEVIYPTFDEERNIIQKSKLKYNYYVTETGKFLMEEWFDTYKINAEGEVIIGKERTFSEFQKFLDLFKYSNDARLLNDHPYIYGCINRNGELSIPLMYDALNFANENACIGTILNGEFLHGYVDIDSGEQITPMAFIDCEPFIDGKALVHYQSSDLERYVSREKIMTNPEDEEEYFKRELK